MVAALHHSTRMAIDVDSEIVRQTLQRLIVSPIGMVAVSEGNSDPRGFIAASVGYTTVSLVPVGQEHGWWAGPDARGDGLRLLIHYERWAKEQGCRFARMSTPPHNERAAQILRKRGFFLSELAWVKAI